MGFIDHYTHLYEIVRHQLSYMQIKMWDSVYMGDQGPNAQCMDYHDLSTKLYSAWGYPRYCDYLSSQNDAIFVFIEAISFGARAGIRTRGCWIGSRRFAI